MKQYDHFAKAYMQAQDTFYSDKKDLSRTALYSLLPALKGKNVLDAGCGFGKDIEHFTKKGAHVYGIDESREMITLAQQKNPNAKLFVESFTKTHFADDFFDIITSRYAIAHEQKLEAVFKEFHRILKPGGILLVLATHPLLHLVASKKKVYGSKETIPLKLFNTFTVTEPAHTLSEYLNQFVLSSFDLLTFYECPAEKSQEMLFKETVPDFFILKLRKK